MKIFNSFELIHLKRQQIGQNHAIKVKVMVRVQNGFGCLKSKKKGVFKKNQEKTKHIK